MVNPVTEQPVTRRNDIAIKVDAEVVRRARIVASYKGLSLAEYVSNCLGPVVDRDLKAEHAKMERALEPDKDRKK